MFVCIGSGSVAVMCPHTCTITGEIQKHRILIIPRNVQVSALYCLPVTADPSAPQLSLSFCRRLESSLTCCSRRLHTIVYSLVVNAPPPPPHLPPAKTKGVRGQETWVVATFVHENKTERGPAPLHPRR